MRNTDSLSHVWPKWRITEHIGSGAYGRVYKAVCDECSMPVYSAIKVISIPDNTAEIFELKAVGLDEKALQEYYRQKVISYINEIDLMEEFKGAGNIVNIDNYKVVERTDAIGFDIYIRMELLTSFNEYLKENKLSQKEIIKLGIDICTALEMFENKNIIHRDIKPENLFVSDYGDFKVGDLGIARRLNSEVEVLSAKGTYSYMAPEVIKGKFYNIRADIYSLGMVLYKLCNNNRFPFADVDSKEIKEENRKSVNLRRLSGEKLPNPINADDAMAAVILHACEFNPNERFQTPTEFKLALKAVDNGEPVSFDKKRYSKTKFKFFVFIVIFFILCVLSCFFIRHIIKKDGFKENKSEFSESEKYSELHTEMSEYYSEVNTTQLENFMDKESIETDGTTDTVVAETESTTHVEITEAESTTESEMDTSETESDETTESMEKQTEVEYEGYIVPEGCMYYALHDTYSEGMKVDFKPSKGDKLITKDYEYSYEEWDLGYGNVFFGWNVQVINCEQTEYEELLNNIAGEKLFMMNYTYSDCVNMKTAPRIPDGVEIMYWTFNNCEKLLNAPNIPKGVCNLDGTFGGCISLKETPYIPEGVTTLNGTFDCCENLITVTNIPDGVTEMASTFSNCIELKNIPELPRSIVNLNGTFKNCKKLTEAPKLPKSVLNLRETFLNCDGIIDAPEIPDSVINMNKTFYGCMSLKTVSVVPASVTNMQETFSGCGALTGEIVINANPAVYRECFANINFRNQKIKLSGNSNMLEELYGTGDK